MLGYCCVQTGQPAADCLDGSEDTAENTEQDLGDRRKQGWSTLKSQVA